MEEKKTEVKKSAPLTKTSKSSKTAATSTSFSNKKESKVGKLSANKENENKIVNKTAVSEYALTDLIPCQSITQGTLIFKSPKTQNEYFWGGCGDICEILYEDLLYLKTKRSEFIYKPYFIILDDIFPNDKDLSSIKEYFDRINACDDIFDNFKLLKDVLLNCPIGFQNMLTEEAVKKTRNNSLTDLKVITLLEKMLNIDLKMNIF